MIVGHVNGAPEPVIRIEVFGAASNLHVEAVVDTGFTGALSLPGDAIQQLGLPWKTWETMQLADDSEISCDILQGSVVWNGGTKQIGVAEGGSTPLVGMLLLEGHRLTVDAIVGGMVTIKPLPSDEEGPDSSTMNH